MFEDFAPRYLEYVTKALEEKVNSNSVVVVVCCCCLLLLCSVLILQRPLALAKIFGAYSIGFKNSRTGHSKRMDVVVMENLLYGHNISRVKHPNLVLLSPQISPFLILISSDKPHPSLSSDKPIPLYPINLIFPSPQPIPPHLSLLR